MKKLSILFIPLFVGILLIVGFKFISSSRVEVAAVQITATPQAEVFLDNVSIGKTPLYNDKLKPGEHTIKLAPTDSSEIFSFGEKVTLRSGVLTVIDRIFKSTEAESETSIISLERLGQNESAEIAIVTTPSGTQIKLDEQPQGLAPLLLKDIAISDHQITITKEGYNSKILRIRPTEGYRLTISAKLAIIRTAQTTPQEEQKESTKSATVKILDTPTGFLRVREKPSVASKEIDRVSPGETFTLLETKEDWHRIKLSDDKEGWINGQYAITQ